MPEKYIKSLPAIRVSEPLEMALMRQAAAQDRTLSDLMRQILEKWAFGHALSLSQAIEFGESNRAMHCEPLERGRV